MYTLSVDYAQKIKERNAEILNEHNISGKLKPYTHYLQSKTEKLGTFLIGMFGKGNRKANQQSTLSQAYLQKKPQVDELGLRN